MKKSLVLAMAMALGVTASAYAANPFSDVPAGHWAYDSISKLAAAGVIEGYGDDTFRGDRLMTRYEMAQIVAKAMAKGANVDKLAAEFADELDALGVRVAALEKKADNVKITGQIRWHYEYHKREIQVTRKRRASSAYPSDVQRQSKRQLELCCPSGECSGVPWYWYGGEELIGEDDDVQINQAYLTGRLGGAKSNGWPLYCISWVTDTSSMMCLMVSV